MKCGDIIQFVIVFEMRLCYKMRFKAKALRNAFV